MKRYALFLWEFYEPGGGWADFVDSFDTIEDAMARAAASPEMSDRQIIDLHTGEDLTPENPPPLARSVNHWPDREVLAEQP